MNGTDPILPSSGQIEPLDAVIFTVRRLQNISGQNEFAKHAADTRFFEPQKLPQIARRDARACLDLDQGMHGRGRQIGAGEIPAHEAEFTDKPARGEADVIYGKGLFGHAKSIMVASCNHNHILRRLPSLDSVKCWISL